MPTGPKGYVWSAAVSQAAAGEMLGRLMDLVFDGSARRLVAHLVEREAERGRPRRDPPHARPSRRRSRDE